MKANILPHPIVYRCIEYKRNPQYTWKTHVQCFPAEEIKSKYVVKSNVYIFLLSRIIVVKIHERLTDRLMAEHREISLGSRFPSFFGWLNYGNKPTTLVRYPEKSQFYSIQYEVLKVKKKQSES
jgi:hypothetical protein